MDTPKNKNSESLRNKLTDFSQEMFFNQPLYLVCIANLDGNFLCINRAFTSILGYNEEELLNKPFIDFVHPQDKKKTRHEIHRLTQGLDTVNFENRYLAKNGEWKWMSWICPAPSMGSNTVYAIASDVTDRKNLEESLLNARKKLEEQSSQLGQKNAALKELMEQLENEKRYWINKWHEDLANSILPDLRKLQLKRESDRSFVTILQKLEGMTQNHSSRIQQIKYQLSPRQKEICELVKSGFTSKEIGRMLNLSKQTIDSYRRDVRKKLGIQNEGINLTACLQETAPDSLSNNGQHFS